MCEGVKVSGMCDEGCMCAFTCACESTQCHAYVPVSAGHQYGNDYRPMGGRARRARGPLAAVVLSPDRGNAGIIRTGRVNGLSNTPLSDLP